MENLSYAIKIGFMLFPILALIITIPYMIRNYHKYGSINFLRSIIIYSFVLYLLVAFFLTILPLPSFETVINSSGELNIQYIPFKFISDFVLYSSFKITDPTTYIGALKQEVFYYPFFNLLLTVPLGFYLRYYFKKSKWEIVIYSFMLSLFFEMTQITSLYGIYPSPYRVFDVDDLLLNTLGGLVGYYITPVLGIILPSKDRIDEVSLIYGERVSLLRRLTAFFLDLLLGVIIYALLSLITSIDMNFSLYSIFMLIYLSIVSLITKGATFGKEIVKIKVVKVNGKDADPHSLMLRYLFRFLIFEESLLFIPWVYTTFNKGIIIYIVLCILVFIVLVVYLDSIFYYKKNHFFVYEKLTKTRIVSTLTSL